MSRVNDLGGILRSLQLIAEAAVSLQVENAKHIWRTTSLRSAVDNGVSNCKTVSIDNLKSTGNLSDIAKDSIDRLSTVIQGLKSYSDVNSKDATKTNIIPSSSSPKGNDFMHSVVSEKVTSQPKEFKIELTESDKKLLRKLDMEHRAKMNVTSETENVQNIVKKPMEISKPLSVPNPKSKQKLSDTAKQRKVPSSRIGRMVSFGTLAAGLGLGTASEYAKRTLGIGDSTPDASSLFLSKGNMDRIVDTLCKVRGAALKLGQIMSIQDESIVNPELAKALERVRKSADFMPNWQVEQMMQSELGFGWRDKFLEFDEIPFAAASIGQVHQGKLKDGRYVAIKIQYPGVARGIESDINNLGGIMKMWNIFPKGMFLENLMSVAKRELAWEVDYVREAKCTKKFKDILEPYPDFYVPSVVDNLSTKQVFTTELLDAVPVDQCFDMKLEDRQFIGDKIMELCLLEILKFRCMQTDPNWANFLYSPDKKQILLLDFGATREYSKEFMDQYVTILKAACDCDRDTVLKVSKDLGFLTGYESKMMEDAHVDAVMILGEVFRGAEYDFGHQDMTLRIQNLAQIMLTQRLCPPPEEIYSLHRKLSGVFLLCTKLKISLNCRDKFLRLYNEYIAQQ